MTRKSLSSHIMTYRVQTLLFVIVVFYISCALSVRSEDSLGEKGLTDFCVRHNILASGIVGDIPRGPYGLLKQMEIVEVTLFHLSQQARFKKS